MLLNKRPPFKYIFNKVKLELLYVCIISLIVYYITIRFENVIPEIPLSIPTFLGTAISVILSFKLSQSYDRWWEARKIWGSIVNDSRNFILQLQAFISQGNDGIIKKMALRHIAWCYCLGQTLRGLDPLENMPKYLSAADINTISQHSNKALAIVQLNNTDIARLTNETKLDRFSHIQINNTLVNFVNQMGMLERIKSTVFPVTYRIFLHMVIYVFIAILSMALRNLESYFEIPLMLVIASFFFLLERTATHLQDPFSNKPTDTAMTAIATTIEINIKQLLGQQDVPEPHKPNDFYLC